MLSKTISSFSNPRIKNVVDLRQKRTRDQSGLTIIDGGREISRAVEAGIKIEEVYYCPALIDPESQKLIKTLDRTVSVVELTQAVMAKISYGDRAEGVAAVARPVRRNLADLKFKKDPFLVVLETVEKPGNLGAVIRSCDGAGVDGVIVCDPLTDIYNPNVIRSSLGVVFALPVVSVTNREALEYLKLKKIKIIAAVVQAKVNYADADLCGPVAIVLGSEQNGLSGFWQKNSDAPVTVPMKGKADSLNVAATASILVYEALRQRSAD